MTNFNRTTALLLVILISFQWLAAQDYSSVWINIDKNDRFNDVNTPFLDGLTMWLLRQNLTSNGLQVQVKSEIPVDKSIDYPGDNRYFEIFIPLMHYKSIGSFVGAAQNKAVIQSEDKRFTRNIQYNYYILVLQYHYKNWKFGLSGEYYYSSNNFVNNSRIGDEWMPLVTAAYAFNQKWQIILLAGYNKNFREVDNKTSPVIAAEVKYKPSKKFNFIIGAPVIFGLDWNVYRDFNFSGKLFITREIETHLSYFIGDIFRFTLNYTSNQNRSSKAFSPVDTVSINNQTIAFNHINHYNNTISLESGIKLQKNTAMTIGAGLKLQSGIELYNNDNKAYKLHSNKNTFIKIGFSYLLYN